MATFDSFTRLPRSGTPPGGRAYPFATVYDGNLWSFGGTTDSTTGDTTLRVQDLSTGAWSAPTVTGAGPDGRFGGASVLVGNVLHMIGGYGGGFKGTAHAEHWTLTITGPTSCTWAQLTPPNLPTSGVWSSGCYHVADNSILYYPGQTNTVGYSNELWRYDLGTLNWGTTALSLSTPPSVRDHANLVYDATRNRVYLINGLDLAGTEFTDVYETDLTVWTLKTCTGTPQQTSQIPGAVWTVLDGVVLFGGYHGSGSGGNLDTISTLNTSTMTWTQPSLSAKPDSGFGGPLFYDSVGRRYVQYAGFNAISYDDDTWGSNIKAMSTRTRTNKYMQQIKQGSSANVTVFMRASSDGTGLSGLSGSMVIKASKNGAAGATITPTITDLQSSLAAGWYSLALTTAHANTVGVLSLHITASGAQDNDDVIVQVYDYVTINLTASGVATAVLDALLTDHAIVGSIADGIAVAMGLLQGNYLQDNVDNSGPNGQVAARMRIFRNSADAAAATSGGVGEGEFATFLVSTTYVGPNKVATHRVVRQ